MNWTYLRLLGITVPNRLKPIQPKDAKQKLKIEKKIMPTQCLYPLQSDLWWNDDILQQWIHHAWGKKVYVTDSVTSMYNNLDEINIIIVLLCVDIQ